MIGVLSQGRMGNQMFQLAFGYVTGEKLSTSYFIYNHNSLHYFNLVENFEEQNKKNIVKFAMRNLFGKRGMAFSEESSKKLKWRLFDWGVNKNVCVWENTIDIDNYLLTGVTNNTFFVGYFQSGEYYSNYEKELKNLFQIRAEHKQKFLETKRYLADKKYIAIHIRRTDYVNQGEKELGGLDIRLPLCYYKQCLAEIKDIAEYNVVFVSDDIEFVKQEFGTLENYFYEYNPEIIDFQILLNADVVIIANSSFSWWAAWLNCKPAKVIYAPNYFSGFNVKKFYPAGIKVDDWNWIDVN